MSRYTIESRTGGSLSDKEFYDAIARARRLHAEAFERSLGQFVGLLGKAVHWLGEWREKRRAVEELEAMDERSLADIGLSRGEIRTAVHGRPVGFRARVRRLFAALEAARQGKVARDELMSMDDRSLADIGLSRADIAYYSSGKSARRVANDDRRAA